MRRVWSGTGEHKVGKKREAKNERYGFGGRKRLGKQNDATSAADTDGYRQGRFDDGLGRRLAAGMMIADNTTAMNDIFPGYPE